MTNLWKPWYTDPYENMVSLRERCWNTQLLTCSVHVVSKYADQKCQNICAVVWIGATYRHVLESMHIEIASDSVHDSVRQIISFILADIKFLVPGTK